MVAPGTLLAGRFRVDEVLAEHGGLCAARGHDEVLNRTVLLQTLPADDPRTAAITSAARAAALAHDSRFLRVLDAAVDDDTAYVVREWVRGTDLGRVLADGPLEPETAGLVVREVARALATAAQQGLHHLRLEPGGVIVAADGGVKITGLATDAAARGLHSRDPAAADARGLGRLLYAALTGRWPDGAAHGLPAAPLVDGRAATPRQVRAGVPRSLDVVTSRALAAGRDAYALGNPAEVAAALDSVLPPGRSHSIDGLLGLAGDTGGPWGTDEGMHPALLVDDSPLDATGPGTVEEAAPRGRGGVARALGVIAGGLLLVGAALFGVQLLLSAIGPEDGVGTGGTPSAQPDQPAGGATPLSLSAASDYDPLGDGREDPDGVAAVIDGDPGTAWRTQTYYDPLEAQKDGVGVVLSLADTASVSAVRLSPVGTGSSLEVRVAPEDATAPPTQPDGWTTVAAATEAGTSVEVTLDEAVRTRWVLVWFTVLPADGANWRGGLSAVEILG